MPKTANYFFALASIMLTAYLVELTSSLCIPFFIAFFVAILLTPAVNLLEKIKLPQMICTLIPVVLVVLLILFLILFLSIQMAGISLKVGTIGQGLNNLLRNTQHWITSTIHIDTKQQTDIMYGSLKGALNTSATLLTNAITFTTSFMSGFVLFVINVICLLYYRQFLIGFLFKSIPIHAHNKLRKIIAKIPPMINGYLLGLFSVIVIIAVLNSIGLLLIGIDNAVLFGTVAALLTIIPYFGILIGASLPTLFALVTTDSLWYPLGVVLVFSCVQFLEGNFLTPTIVSSRISINPYAAIIALLLFGMFLGLVGILLALPILAVFKVVLDEFDSTKPYGYLIGAARD